MKTSVELSKVIVSDIFFCDTDSLKHGCHHLSFFLRWHSPGNPCSHWHTTRGPHTWICKSYVSFAPFLSSLGLFSCRVSDWINGFLFRSSTVSGNTRSASRVLLVPSRSCWSIRTRPVPLLLFCPSLLQMTSFKTSQHRRPPLSRRPLLSHRSASSMQWALFMHWSVCCKTGCLHVFVYWNSSED